MGINQVLLEGKVAADPRRKTGRGNIVFEFVLESENTVQSQIERFTIEITVGRLRDLEARKGDQVLVLGHLKEERSHPRSKHSRVTIHALKVKRLLAPEAVPTIALEELGEILGGDDIPF